MKKIYLIALGLFLTLASFAQSTIGTASDLQIGKNEHFDEQSTNRTDAYWKYTSSKDEVLIVEPLYGCNVMCEELGTDAEGNPIGVQVGTAAWGVKSLFPAPAGKTIYIHANGYQQMGVSVEAQDSKDVAKGTDANNVGEIVPGTIQLFGNSNNFGSSSPIYAKYTPEKDGVLKLTAYGSLSGVVCNGVTYESTHDREAGTENVAVVVKGGQENLLQIISWGAFGFTSEMTYPQPGSLDSPFAIAEGSNVVPKEAGTYWYLTSTDKRGVLTIHSDAALTDGKVAIYRNRNAVDNDYVLAQSEVGTYNLKYDTEANQNYYIKVEKKVATDADDAFDYKIAEYQPGDREDTPIEISDFSKEYTAPAGQTTYFSFAVPQGEKKFVVVEATSPVEKATTQVAVYQSSSSQTTGHDKVRAMVSGNSYSSATYYIVWTSAEATPVNFKISFEELQKGDDITMPLDAVMGENTVANSGTQYYQIVAPFSGKLEVTVPEGASVAFPVSATSAWNNYDTTVDGQTYAIDATEGVAYLITLSNVKAGDKFTIAKGEWKEGEARTNPILVEGDKYVLGDKTVSNVWLRYTAKKDGILAIDSDVPYSYSNKIAACKDADGEIPQSIVTYGKDATGNWGYTYGKTFMVSANESYLVRVQLDQPYAGKAVTFTLRDAALGETPANPLVLVPGEALDVPTATGDMPVWIKMTLDVGDIKFEANDYMNAFIYKGLENAKNDMNGQRFAMNYESGSKGDPTAGAYTCTMSLYGDDEAGDYYLKVVSCYGAKLTATGDGILTGIKEVNAAQNARMEVYNLNGVKVADVLGASIQNCNLPKGVYVVKVNGKAKKIALK